MTTPTPADFLDKWVKHVPTSARLRFEAEFRSMVTMYMAWRIIGRDRFGRFRSRRNKVKP